MHAFGDAAVEKIESSHLSLLDIILALYPYILSRGTTRLGPVTASHRAFRFRFFPSLSLDKEMYA